MLTDNIKLQNYMTPETCSRIFITFVHKHEYEGKSTGYHKWLFIGERGEEWKKICTFNMFWYCMVSCITCVIFVSIFMVGMISSR